MVVEEPADHLHQPPSLFGDGLVHPPSQFLLHFLEFCPHAIASALPFDQELAGARLAADEGEAQEVEGLRLAEPALRAFGRRMAAELDQTGLVRMQRQRELLEPCAHRIEEPTGVGLVLEADDHIVRIACDDHVASRLAPSPAPGLDPGVGPEVQHVMQVDVGKQRRDHRALPRPPVTDRHRPVFENARLQPFADQADDALVADAALDEPDQPVLADRVEKAPDVGVQYPVHLPAADCDRQGVERIVRSASGPEPVREPEEAPGLGIRGSRSAP